jgi:hypothetical protein
VTAPRWLLGVLLVLHVAAAMHVAFGTDWARPNFVSGDHLAYRATVAAPGVAYRDKTVVFPPLSYAAFDAIESHTGVTTSGRLLVGIQLASDLAIAGALAAAWGRRAAVAWLALLIPFLPTGWVFARIDLLSVALAVGGLALIRRRAERSGGLLMALGTLAKVWPLAILPGLVVEGRRRAAIWAAGTLGLAGTVWLIIGGASGVLDTFTFGHATGWQIESTIGAVRFLAGGGPVRLEVGALRVGSTPGWAGPLLDVVLVALVAAAWGLAAQRRDDPRVADVARLAAVGAVLVCSPVLSPQYLVWVLPFVAVLAVDGAVVTLGALAVVATAALAYEYDPFQAGETRWQLVAVGRNAVLVALVAVGFARLISATSAARTDRRTRRSRSRAGWRTSPGWTGPAAACTSGTTSPGRRT